MISVYKDTNSINSKQQDQWVNEIEELAEKYPDYLIIEKADTLDTELLENPSYNADRLKKSDGYIESYGLAVLGHSRLGPSVLGTEKEDQEFSEILEIIFGKKQRSEYTKQEIRDAMHVMTAIRYGGTYLITNDKKMILSSDKLFKRFNSTKISSPIEALQMIKQRIKLLIKHRQDHGAT